MGGTRTWRKPVLESHRDWFREREREAVALLGVSDGDLYSWQAELDNSSEVSRNAASGGTFAEVTGGGVTCIAGTGGGTAYTNEGTSLRPLVGQRKPWVIAARCKWPTAIAATGDAHVGAVSVSPFTNSLGVGVSGGVSTTQLRLLRYNSSYVVQNSVDMGILRTAVSDWVDVLMRSDGTTYYAKVNGLTGWITGEAVTALADIAMLGRTRASDSGTDDAQISVARKVFFGRLQDV